MKLTPEELFNLRPTWSGYDWNIDWHKRYFEILSETELTKFDIMNSYNIVRGYEQYDLTQIYFDTFTEEFYKNIQKEFNKRFKIDFLEHIK